MTAAAMCAHRITIITGHYGTGKTEFAVNLALALARERPRVMLADLDIVNPYFRSRERRDLLESAGIRLISSSQACSDADVPALPAELLAILEDRSITGILDIGGGRPGIGPVPAQDSGRRLPASLRTQRQPSRSPHAGSGGALPAGH